MPKKSSCPNCRVAYRSLDRCSCPDAECEVCRAAKERLADCDCTDAATPSEPVDFTQIKIEKGVPIPPHRSATPNALRSLLRSMEIDDSILVPLERNKIAWALHEVRRGGVKFVTSKEPGGIRVWEDRMTPSADRLTRSVILAKDPWIGAFFLFSGGELNRIWTFDPRNDPPFCYFDHPTRELAIKRLDELVHISIQNGWHVHHAGPPNIG